LGLEPELPEASVDRKAGGYGSRDRARRRAS
jgi:hypothetical protein